jgi:hypothetical protein
MLLDLDRRCRKFLAHADPELVDVVFLRWERELEDVFPVGIFSGLGAAEIYEGTEEVSTLNGMIGVGRIWRKGRRTGAEWVGNGENGTEKEDAPLTVVSPFVPHAKS